MSGHEVSRTSSAGGPTAAGAALCAAAACANLPTTLTDYQVLAPALPCQPMPQRQGSLPEAKASYPAISQACCQT